MSNSDDEVTIMKTNFTYPNVNDEDLQLKEMYKDEKRRKNRIENLKLAKVQELLFDEFINKLKEVKIKVPRVSKSKTEKKTKEQVVIISTGKLNVDFKITENKTKDKIIYKIKISNEGKKIEDIKIKI